MNFMSKSWPLFRALGVPVRLHISFLAIFGIIAITSFAFLPLYLTLVVSVVAHEYGHVLAARQFGTRCEVIYLHFFGGAAMLHPSSEPSLTEDWVVALAGPIVSFALGFIFSLIGYFSESIFLLQLGILNLFIGAFNLLPIYPMDGGRIFKALMERIFDKDRGTTIAIITARVLAIAGAILGVIYGYYIVVAVAAFVILLGYNEQAQIKASKRVGPFRRG